MTTYPRLSKKERLKLLKTWDTLAKHYERVGYTSNQATDRQLDKIYALASLLDRRDASTLIDLLDELVKRNNCKNGGARTKEYACGECGKKIKKEDARCMQCDIKVKKMFEQD